MTTIVNIWPPESVRALRRSLGLNQQDFSALLGVTLLTVSRWELGKCYPQAAQREALLQLAKQQQEAEQEADAAQPAHVRHW